MTNEYEYLYGGISGIKIEMDAFSLGEGIEVRKTYSHLFSTTMMAFAPPGPEGFHPAPWKAAKGGFSYDIEVEIRAPLTSSLGKTFDGKEIIWWIAALLRIAQFPHLSVPVLSNFSFKDIPCISEEPILKPFEIDKRIFAPQAKAVPVLKADLLSWVADNWRTAGQLLINDKRFYSAFKAFDSATIHGRTASSLLALWGGLEELFVPSPAELRFRVAALLSSYLEHPGESRLELYKKIKQLYSKRSTAAHTSQDVGQTPLIETYFLMRNALIKIIETGQIPSQEVLESCLFCVSTSD